MKKKSKIKKWLLALLILLILAGFGVATVVFMALQNKVGYTEPFSSEPDEVSPYLTHYLMPQFFDAVQLEEPFSLLIDQNGINDILSRDSTIKGGWPATYDPVQIYAPRVVFGENGLTLFDKISYKGINLYVSLEAGASIGQDGNMKIDVSKVAMGSFNMTAMVKAIAKKIAKPYYQAKDKLNNEQRIFYGVIFDEPFNPIIKIGENRLKITDVNLTQGQMVLYFEPVEKLVPMK